MNARRWRFLPMVFLGVLSGTAFGENVAAPTAAVEQAWRLAREGKWEQIAPVLKPWGKDVVPLLLGRLKGGGNRQTIFAAYALTHCWAPEAFGPLMEVIGNAKAPMAARQAAFLALANNAPERRTMDAFEKNIDAMPPALIARALEYLEKRRANPELVKKYAAARACRRLLAPYLPRYDSLEFVETALEIAKSGRPREKAFAIAALRYQWADDPETRRSVISALTDQDPSVRAAAADYLAWTGDAEARAATRKARDRENDLFAAASMRAAEKMCREREKRGKDAEDVAAAARKELGKTLAARPCVFFWDFHADDLPKVKEAAKAYLLERRLEKRVAIGDLSASAPLCPESPPVTPRKVWTPPVREYFDVGRTCFGARVRDASEWKGLYHVGDEVAIDAVGETVVSIGDGVVRDVGWDLSTGYRVAIAYRDRDIGPFCAVYFHLGPPAAIAVGDKVRSGAKIGVVGRSWSFDNGGVPARLRFALHKGEYGDGSWVTGYLPADIFRKEDHGWFDPQPFLRENTRDYSRFFVRAAGRETFPLALPGPEPKPPARNPGGMNAQFGEQYYLPTGWTKPKVIMKGNGVIYSPSVPIFGKPFSSGVTVGTE